MNTVTIQVHVGLLSETGRRFYEMLCEHKRLYRVIPEPRDGVFEMDIFDPRYSDDVPAVQLRSNLSWSERARRFGVTGLDPSHMERDENGSPIPVGLATHSYRPTAKHIENVVRVYGDEPPYLEWVVPSEILQAVRWGLDGDQAWEWIANAFFTFCEKAEYTPEHFAHGGHREGAGRPPLADEPLVRVDVRLTRSDIEALKRVDANLSAALRRVIAEWRKE